MKRIRLLLVSAVCCLLLALTVPASAPIITARIDMGSAEVDIGIGDVIMSVLAKRGIDVVLGQDAKADIIVKLRTMEELGGENAGGQEKPESAENEFSDGSASLESGPVLTMSESSAGSSAAYIYSKALAQEILEMYSQTGGVPLQNAMQSAELDGTIPSVMVKVDAMPNPTSTFSVETEAGQAWVGYIICDGITRYFNNNPGAVTGRTGTGNGNAALTDPAAASSALNAEAQLPESGHPSTTEGRILAESPAGAQEGQAENAELQGSQTANTASQEARNTLEQSIYTTYTSLPQIGKWAVYVCDLKNNLSAYAPTTAEQERMQAASLIKLFIMGAVYEKYDELSAAYGSETLDGYLYPMITVSDNDAANALVEILGGGDSSAGMGVVNAYCQNHGYTATSMGRLLLASKEFGDNYTSVVDCGKFLTEIYRTVYGSGGATETGDIWSSYQSVGNMPHASEMLSLLSQQERTHKIPAGLPDGVKTANKTGELGDVENDAAIIYDTDNGNDLVIVFMSENLTEPGTAQSAISTGARSIYDFYH